MSRHLRVWHLVSALLLLSVLTACNAASGIAATPTKTPVPFIAADQGAATPVPFATPTPDAIAVGPDNYPPDVSQLTGLKVDDPAVLERRPLEIVVSNSPPDWTRPQAGLNSADIVYEYFAEGRQTRYTAIFQSQTPEAVGSVRSCRPINYELTLMYDALWVCSGYSIGTKENYIVTSPNYQWHFSYEKGDDYTQDGNPMLTRVSDPNILAKPDPDIPLEHTLYAFPAGLWEEAEARGLNERVQLDGLAFHSIPPDGGYPAVSASVDYEAGFRYTWEYDAESGTYLRFDPTQTGTDGRYIDKLTGEQLSFENVVVITAGQSFTDYPEDTISGAEAVIQEIWGEGSLTLFRDGMRYDGTWQRPPGDNMMTYYDLNGNVLPLRPGKTWVQVLDQQAERLTVEP